MEEQTVIVAVTLVIRVAGSWGDDCTLGQLRGQAVQSANDDVARLVAGKATEADIKRIAVREIAVDAVAWKMEGARR